LGREPTLEEVGAAVALTPARVRELRDCLVPPTSLDTPIGADESLRYRDLVEDCHAEEPEVAGTRADLHEQLAALLGTLEARERQVLELHYGLNTSREYTLAEIGGKLGLSGARIRQIEAKALRKLRHPTSGSAVAAARQLAA